MTAEELSKMTSGDKDIAVAEALGFQYREAYPSGKQWYDKAGKRTDRGQCPRFSTDLNAMHEAEIALMGRLTPDEWCDYVRNLQLTTGKQQRPPFVVTVSDAFAYAIHATAAQRADAFLLTINPETP